MSTDDPERRIVAAGEGWRWFVTERDGRYLLIVDDGSLRDILGNALEEGDERLFGESVLEFATAAERDRYLEKHTTPRAREIGARLAQRERED